MSLVYGEKTLFFSQKANFSQKSKNHDLQILLHAFWELQLGCPHALFIHMHPSSPAYLSPSINHSFLWCTSAAHQNRWPQCIMEDVIGPEILVHRREMGAWDIWPKKTMKDCSVISEMKHLPLNSSARSGYHQCEVGQWRENSGTFILLLCFHSVKKVCSLDSAPILLWIRA